MFERQTQNRNSRPKLVGPEESAPDFSFSKEQQRLHTSVNRVIAEYYRCADNAMDFRVQGLLSVDAGYFRFGSDIICYGRSTAGLRSKLAGGELYDALLDTGQDGSVVTLSFNPNEIASNLRYERYAAAACRRPHRELRTTVRKAYYMLRPALPVAVRKHLQKIHLNGWNEIKFPKWPVDRTVDHLMQKLLNLGMRAKGLNEVPFIWFWPDGAKGCAIMTHDVETRAGQNFCSQLMDINEEFGIPASFQIVPEKRYPISAEFINSMWDRGFEVNVQDLNHDGFLFSDWDEFRRRAEKINGYAKQFHARGFRSAVLYRNQDWYDALDFEYDLTVPNVAHLDPQRGGCCTVLPYFVGKTLELPVTTTQDYSLFHILKDYSLSLWKTQIELILKESGLISFIVHPDYIISERAQATYRQLLQLLSQLRSERNVWIARPQDVNDWWRARSQLQLKQEHGRWRIEGPGSERARLAFATVSDDGVVYSIPELQKARAIAASSGSASL